MQEQDVTVKGIILSAAPQGEYGRRLSILTDRYGKICVFAQAAAKPKSHLMGVTLPMVCAEFTIARGRGAWNLHGVRLIEAFSSLSLDLELSCHALYFLEVLSWFSQEGMEENEAKRLLNLTFVALRALSEEKDRKTEGEEKERAQRILLIRRIFELRILVIEGEYTEKPEGSASEAVEVLWKHVEQASLGALYEEKFFSGIRPETAESFCYFAGQLFKRMVPCKFKSLAVLREFG